MRTLELSGRGRAKWIAIGAALALTVTSTAARAVTEPDAGITADDVADTVAAVAPDVAVQEFDAGPTGELVATTVGEGEVTIDENDATAVLRSVDGSTDLTLQLPVANAKERVAVAADGTAVFSGSGSSDVAVQAMQPNSSQTFLG